MLVCAKKKFLFLSCKKMATNTASQSTTTTSTVTTSVATSTSTVQAPYGWDALTAMPRTTPPGTNFCGTSNPDRA